MADPSLRATQLFGLTVHVGRLRDAVDDIVTLAHRGQGRHVCVASVDSLVRAHDDAAMAGAWREAALVLTDGMPIVWALRLAGHRNAQRVCGPDLLPPLLTRAAHEQLPVWFLGGTPAELQRIVARCAWRFPGLRVVGHCSPPQLPEQPPFDARLVDEINASGARLVLVGLGCPKQEHWMQTHAPHLHAVCIGVGYAFPLMAGTARRAPDWAQRAGLEWAFRLAEEPRRLWRRYLVGNTRFLVLLASLAWRRATARSPLPR